MFIVVHDNFAIFSMTTATTLLFTVFDAPPDGFANIDPRLSEDKSFVNQQILVLFTFNKIKGHFNTLDTNCRGIVK